MVIDNLNTHGKPMSVQKYQEQANNNEVNANSFAGKLKKDFKLVKFKVKSTGSH